MQDETRDRNASTRLGDEELRALLDVERFPRSGRYDPRWQIEHQMGPNVLWLTEYLCEKMDLRPGMRVLDLGCGKALSSIFLAKEFDVQVWATDLWIGASENWRRIREAGVEDRVFPIHAEARSLPFAGRFFDAVVSMDAYHYFGTDQLYLPVVARLVVRGGRIGIVVPGTERELGAAMPEAWPRDLCTLHTPEWWRQHWEASGGVRVEVADRMPEGWELWMRWIEVTDDPPGTDPDRPLLVGERGRELGFTRVVATVAEASPAA